MIRLRHIGLGVGMVLLLLATSAAPLLAHEAKDAPPDVGGVAAVALLVLLGLVACVGAGATVLVLRILLPVAARAGDAALDRVGTKQILLSGIVPLVGAGLVAQGVGQTGSEALGLVFLLLVGLPLLLAWIVGAMAAIPHVGTRALSEHSLAGPGLRAAVGGLVIGLSLASWALPPLGLLLSLLLSGWFLAIGIGAFVHRAPAAAAPAGPAEDPVG